MRAMPAIDTPPLERNSSHQARSFADLPDINAAVGLLGEIARAPCSFSPVPMDRPLALYGAGSLGRLARKFLTSVDRDFALVVDLNADELARDRYWSDVALKHPDAVSRAEKHTFRLAVSIVNSPYVPIERSLRERGFEDVVPFYDLAESFRAVHPLSNGWFTPPMSAEDRKNAAAALAGWDDDVSRAHHLQFLAWRRLREEWNFAGAPVPDCIRFFIPEVTGVLSDQEILLDAGAHHGSVIETFVKQTKGRFQQIVAIEPDPFNRALLANNLQSWLPDNPGVTVYDCVLADGENAVLFHEGLGYASQLSPTGQRRVVTRPLDALGLSPTFLKLHLEGAELPTLKGARETLLSSRPIVAATVYHNADGIWKTPLWLMQTLPDYRFLFRAHSWCGTGAVVYAIPDERAS
ncbi:MAG: FkbM family methyltransferase [Pseudolabrys sp.]